MKMLVYAFKSEMCIEDAHGTICKVRKNSRWILHMLYVCIF